MQIIIFLILSLSSINLSAGEKIICNYCHKPIQGDYVIVEGKYYHPSHFICDWCKKPIKSKNFIKYNEKYYHENCFINHIVPKCYICGKPVKGAYIKNYWGQIYHPYHEKNIKKCEYCARIIKNPKKEENGFYVCDICKRKEVNDLFEAKHKVSIIAKILYKYGINVNVSDLKIELWNFDEFKNISNTKNITSDNKGMAEFKIKDFGNKKEKEYRICLLKNMPDFTFVEVASHELMHIWIYKNVDFKQQDALVEGSCNLAAYLVLNELKKDNPFSLLKLDKRDIEYSLEKLKKNNDPVYGVGFNVMKNYADKFGIFMWLNYLKHHKNLPHNF